MPKTRQQKEQTLAELKSGIKQSKAVVFSTYTALTVKDDQQLRAKLREKDVKFGVFKKTLLKIVLDEAGIEGKRIQALSGNIAAAFSPDEVLAAKILAKFAKGKETFVLKAGILEGAWIDEAKVEELAQLPSREELLAKIVSSFNAPLAGFVNVLGGVARNFVYALNAIKEKKA